MKLKLIKALWGMEGTGTLEEQVGRIASAGYDGVEAPLPAPDDEQRFKELLASHGLDYVGMIFTEGPDHYASFEAQLERATSFGPIHVTAHSLRDYVPLEEQIDYFRRAVQLEQQLGVKVGHETHRGRALFNPWDTGKVLNAVPGLGLTADFSHWCCVTESTLEHFESELDLAIARTVHIHGRVGYAQGPQVPDPRAPEYAHEVARHFDWWNRIADARQQAGASELTFTPEYGPPGYLHTLPFTNQPVTDLWQVCKWTVEQYRENFERTQSVKAT
ncbi:xylose isomerase [Paenibacillus sp. SSG-1]|uniref:sugar phosphate isomerase/epimerase family protein n=1 Tax=Paenibacillus sp. SSG-1 TaxID=1443669 RepID=UPI000B7E762A|nr:TIM barrel protein [Paenibacillus sp. SSG-1]OXL84507.1 xylose isomerase [Paenibacillus sp. SSG-1]